MRFSLWLETVDQNTLSRLAHLIFAFGGEETEPSRVMQSFQDRFMQSLSTLPEPKQVEYLSLLQRSVATLSQNRYDPDVGELFILPTTGQYLPIREILWTLKEMLDYLRR